MRNAPAHANLLRQGYGGQEDTEVKRGYGGQACLDETPARQGLRNLKLKAADAAQRAQ